MCRRDSFITHRAFCDALAEENNKVNQGMLQPQHMHDHIMSSNSIDSGNMLMGLPDFNNYEPKASIKSLPRQDLVPMPFKSLNMSADMYSSSSGTLFGNPRGGSSSSSGLQLSSTNGSLGYGYFQQDSKVGGLLPGLAGHMSATALLQKAAQMGATATATASIGVNSPMMQKSFVTSMTGSDQINSHRPRPVSPYGIQGTGGYDTFHIQPNQTTMIGINDGSTEGYNPLQKPDPQDSFGPDPNPNMNDLGIYSELLMGGHQDHETNHEDRSDENSTLIQERGKMSMTSKLGGNDMLTVDFLGIGGSRSLNIQEQEQRFNRFEATSQAMNPFQQQLIHGESSAHEKPIWE